MQRASGMALHRLLPIKPAFYLIACPADDALPAATTATFDLTTAEALGEYWSHLQASKRCRGQQRCTGRMGYPGGGCAPPLPLATPQAAPRHASASTRMGCLQRHTCACLIKPCASPCSSWPPATAAARQPLPTPRWAGASPLIVRPRCAAAGPAVPLVALQHQAGSLRLPALYRGTLSWWAMLPGVLPSPAPRPQRTHFPCRHLWSVRMHTAAQSPRSRLAWPAAHARACPQPPRLQGGSISCIFARAQGPGLQPSNDLPSRPCPAPVPHPPPAMQHTQMAVLAAYLAGEEARSMSAARCREVAAQLQLPYEAVSVPSHSVLFSNYGRFVRFLLGLLELCSSRGNFSFDRVLLGLGQSRCAACPSTSYLSPFPQLHLCGVSLRAGVGVCSGGHPAHAAPGPPGCQPGAAARRAGARRGAGGAPDCHRWVGCWGCPPLGRVEGS